MRAVGQAVRACSSPPLVWVQSSSLAIFGEGGFTVIDESTAPTGIARGRWSRCAWPRRCVPTRLLAVGFAFTQHDFEAAADLAPQRCGAL